MATNAVDALRHVKVFDPVIFGDRRVDVIGAGATGSRIAISLAKLGIVNLHVWDFDRIEAHNIANQAFGVGDIGKFKVDALADHIKALTGLDIVKHNEPATPESEFGSVVFMLTDTMKSRAEIWEGAIEYKHNVEVMIETRMGAYEGRIFTVRPNVPTECDFWRATLFKDEEATASLCGSAITVGPTAEMISGYAVWQFIRWWKHFNDGDKMPENEVVKLITPKMTLFTRRA